MSFVGPTLVGHGGLKSALQGLQRQSSWFDSGILRRSSMSRSLL